MKVLPNVAYLFQSDTNVNVQKRVITTAAHLYPILIQVSPFIFVFNFFQYCVKTKTPAIAKTTFESFWALKTQILALLDHDNDGVRTHTIKFYETCILVQSLQTEVGLGLQCPEMRAFADKRAAARHGRTFGHGA